MVTVVTDMVVTDMVVTDMVVTDMDMETPIGLDIMTAIGTELMTIAVIMAVQQGTIITAMMAIAITTDQELLLLQI